MSLELLFAVAAVDIVLGGLFGLGVVGFVIARVFFNLVNGKTFDLSDFVINVLILVIGEAIAAGFLSIALVILTMIDQIVS